MHSWKKREEKEKSLVVESYVYAHWAQISFPFQCSFSSKTDRDIYSGESCYTGKTMCHFSGGQWDDGKRKDSSAVRLGKKKPQPKKHPPNQPNQKTQTTTHTNTKVNQPQFTRVGPASQKVTKVSERSGSGGPHQGHSYNFFSNVTDHFIKRFLLPKTSSL